MSSSASKNNKNQIVIYKGRVLHTQNFSDLCTSDPKLKEVADAFSKFWKYGYHTDLSKHAAFARPSEILNLNVRHSHVDTQDYTPEDSNTDISGKKSVWDGWKSIASIMVKHPQQAIVSLSIQ